MPSPSRIPRPKIHAPMKRGKENVQETKLQSQRNDTKGGNIPTKKMLKKPASKIDIKLSVKPAMVQNQKKSPLRVVSENKFRQTKNENRSPPKTMLHDRRGISEIKRSEKNLRSALETMESDFETMKHEFNESKREVAKKEHEIDSLRLEETQLKERLKDLQNVIDVQAEVLEKVNRDPVTGSGLSHDILTSMAEEKRLDKTSSAFNLLQYISEMKLSLREIQNRLDLNS